MARHGDLRWHEEIVVDGDKIIRRDKKLQQYIKYGFGVSCWSNIDTDQRIEDITDLPENEKKWYIGEKVILGNA